ncbi:MAG: homoserine kinase [Bacteroidota bacterium]
MRDNPAVVVSSPHPASIDLPATQSPSSVAVFGPASLSNLGPGFDALGLCIGGAGDTIIASLSDEPGVRITSISGDAGLLPLDAPSNTAAVAAGAVLSAADFDVGLELRIEKNVPFGSGIGGSAASAVAGAWAANLALGTPFDKEALVEAVLAGEAVASGARHGDNVLPALFGGLVLVSSSDPTRFRQIALPRPLHLAIIAPAVQVLTRVAREILPQNVGLRDAVHNAAELAFLLDAFRVGDWETVGRCIMSDRLVEPVRATLVPCYDAVRHAAMESGAFGCALTGSGPALFAVAESPDHAELVLESMITASHAAGTDATGFVTEANPHGVTGID